MRSQKVLTPLPDLERYICKFSSTPLLLSFVLPSSLSPPSAFPLSLPSSYPYSPLRTEPANIPSSLLLHSYQDNECFLDIAFITFANDGSDLLSAFDYPENALQPNVGFYGSAMFVAKGNMTCWAFETFNDAQIGKHQKAIRNPKINKCYSFGEAGIVATGGNTNGPFSCT